MCMDGMNNMEMVSLAIVILLSGLCGVESVDVTGKEQSEVTIKCSHRNAFSNRKYFCKDPCTRDEHVLIKNGGKKDFSNGKYRIQDQGNTFLVTIKDLTTGESGRYWCGIDRVGADTYNEVLLRVLVDTLGENANEPTDTLGENANEPTDTLGENANEPTGHLIYIGAGLGVAVVLLALIITLFIRLRNRETRTSNGKNHATSANQQLDDGLLYSTVTFRNTAHHNAVTLDEESVVYDTVKKPVPHTENH